MEGRTLFTILAVLGVLVIAGYVLQFLYAVLGLAVLAGIVVVVYLAMESKKS
ncbi:MAG: hypothetical protein AAFX04_05735 [Pseudomonadota bacterium]